jgi:hypothetical protein
MTLVIGSIVLGTLTPVVAIVGLIVVLALLGSVDAFPVEEFREGLGDIKRGIGENKEQLGFLEGSVKSVKKEHEGMRAELDKVRRVLAHGHLGRPSGGVGRRAGR